MLDAFRAANPDLDLKAVTLDWGNPYYTKLSLATLGDKPPDVAISHLTRMKTLVASDLLEELKLEDLARFGMTPDKLDRTAWEAGLVDGKAYAIPLDTHPFVMFYNTDVCKKAGLLDSAGQLLPLDSPEKFTDAMHKGEGGHRAVRRGDRGQQRHLDPVAGVPVVLQPARRARPWPTTASRWCIDDAKATQVLDVHASPGRPAGCSRPPPTTRARSPRSPPGRPASTSRASGRSPPSRPPRCRSR